MARLLFFSWCGEGREAQKLTLVEEKLEFYLGFFFSKKMNLKRHGKTWSNLFFFFEDLEQPS